MDLNESSDEHERIFMGNEFHKRGGGGDTKKALFPQDRDAFGSVRRCLSAERKPVREEVYGTTSPVMKDEACVFMARYVRSSIFDSIRRWTGSLCKSNKMGIMCSEGLARAWSNLHYM